MAGSSAIPELPRGLVAMPSSIASRPSPTCAITGHADWKQARNTSICMTIGIGISIRFGESLIQGHQRMKVARWQVFVFVMANGATGALLRVHKLH